LRTRSGFRDREPSGYNPRSFPVIHEKAAAMSTQDSEHESMIKTPTQLAVVVVLSFIVPVILLIMLAQFVLSATKPDPALLVQEAVVARIKPVADITISEAGSAGGVRSGEEIVKAACAACHTTGAANAPKTGDKAGWAPRLGLGLDGLVKSAIKGKGGMPPRGGLPDLSDHEIALAVVDMANKSGASFKAPAAPKAAAAKK